MKTHDESIYHCVTCGRVEHAKLKEVPPECCGQTMTRACAVTVNQGDVAARTAGGDMTTAPSAIEGRTKPR